MVVTRGIDPGATVVASFQAPVLFVIAKDLRKMKILADVDEADVGKIAEDMDADGRGLPRQGLADLQREQRLGCRHLPRGRLGGQPRGEASPRHDVDDHSAHA